MPVLVVARTIVACAESGAAKSTQRNHNHLLFTGELRELCV
jgi:hypothetical protein